MDSLPNESRKYELVDYTVWHGISDLSRSNYVLLLLYKLPFQYNTSDGYDLKVMFLTSKENILRVVS